MGKVSLFLTLGLVSCPWTNSSGFAFCAECCHLLLLWLSALWFRRGANPLVISTSLGGQEEVMEVGLFIFQENSGLLLVFIRNVEVFQLSAGWCCSEHKGTTEISSSPGHNRSRKCKTPTIPILTFLILLSYHMAVPLMYLTFSSVWGWSLSNFLHANKFFLHHLCVVGRSTFTQSTGT